MPIVNGVGVSKELKRIMPEVPIILFTQYADLGNLLLSTGLAVDRITSKTNGQELIGHVKSLIPV
jgi:hypothetical protein